VARDAPVAFEHCNSLRDLHEEHTMFRRAFLLALLVALTAAPVWAAETATFVLTNGDRVSGTLIYGRGDNCMNDLQFHVNVAGRDVAIHRDRVAAIDFAGGNPPKSELDALPTTSSTWVIVFRDGSMTPGELTNIIINDVVQWVPRGGQRQNWAARDVSRVYLNPPAARQAYIAAAATRPAPQAPPPDNAGQRQGGDTVRLAGTQRWVDSGIDVRRGDRLAFAVQGTITVNSNGAKVGPDGTPGSRNARYPMPDAPLGALIGRVGNGAPFLIGSETGTMTMTASGALMIGINDDYLDDNGGAFRVTIFRQ
jgi:hypothetical protein